MFFELVLTRKDWSEMIRGAPKISTTTLNKLNGAIPVLLGDATDSPRVTSREFETVRFDLERTSLFFEGLSLEPKHEDGRLVLRERSSEDPEGFRPRFFPRRK